MGNTRIAICLLFVLCSVSLLVTAHESSDTGSDLSNVAHRKLYPFLGPFPGPLPFPFPDPFPGPIPGLGDPRRGGPFPFPDPFLGPFPGPFPNPWRRPDNLGHPSPAVEASYVTPAREAKPISACISVEWLNPKYSCHWKNATPLKITVGEMFGKVVEEKYGNISAYMALQSEDNLLQQAVAAMMNAITSDRFYLSPTEVKMEFTMALADPEHLEVNTVEMLMQFNTGYGIGQCMLSPCP